jgi:3-hydroxy-3-methylglutaryl CoA synthase
VYNHGALFQRDSQADEKIGIQSYRKGEIIMFYISTLKKLYDAIKNDESINENDKKELLKHITTVINIIAMY